MLKNDTKKKLGFTLIELLVVIAIISIIGAVGVPWYQGYKIQAKEKQAINNLQSIKLAQTEYYRIFIAGPEWDSICGQKVLPQGIVIASYTTAQELEPLQLPTGP